MAEHDNSFHPEGREEDVEQRFSQFSAEDVQLVHELREQYSRRRTQSERVLARAWERIQQEQQPANESFMRDARGNTPVPTLPELKREFHMKDIKSETQQPKRLKRTLNVLAAIIVIAVLVGSLGLVYSHLHSQTRSGAGPQASATAQTAGTTPTARQTAGATPTTQQTAGVTPTVQASPTPLANGGSLNWPVGIDTYWANQRYHQLTAYWVAWSGNANQWLNEARSAGWKVSQTPHMPSIMVLMSYVQGANAYGHVAVVESLVPNSSPTAVHTSNMNWVENGGGWDKVSYADFIVGPGVYFIWHP